jgi:hypothetical protein
MRQLKERITSALRRGKTSLAPAIAAVASLAENNAMEIAVGIGLVLITVALWQDLGQRALAVPGALLVWIALPQRTRFIEPTPRASEPKGKS